MATPQPTRPGRPVSCLSPSSLIGLATATLPAPSRLPPRPTGTPPASLRLGLHLPLPPLISRTRKPARRYDLRRKSSLSRRLFIIHELDEAAEPASVCCQGLAVGGVDARLGEPSAPGSRQAGRWVLSQLSQAPNPRLL